jgi:hypothetical protein
MGKLSAGTISLLQPIANAIDAELERPQEDRKNFLIQCAAPHTMKSNLVMYKTLLRRDWNGKFWMNKKKEGVEISFSPSRLTYFSIQRMDGTPAPPAAGFVIDRDEFRVRPEVLLNMSDGELSQYMLIEAPREAFVSTHNLTEESRMYIADPNNREQPALFRLLHRRGYHWTLRDNVLKIHT